MGFVLLAAALLVTMSRSAIHRTGTNRVHIRGPVSQLQAGQAVCESGEIVPAGTGAIRASVYPTSDHNGTLLVTVRTGGRILARGSRAAAGGEPVAVRMHPPIRRETRAAVCVTARGDPPYLLGGDSAEPGHAAIEAYALGADIRIDYLRDRPESWWSVAPTTIARLGPGQPLSGTGLAVAVLVLSLAAAALAARQLTRGRP